MDSVTFSAVEMQAIFAILAQAEGFTNPDHPKDNCPEHCAANLAALRSILTKTALPEA